MRDADARKPDGPHDEAPTLQRDQPNVHASRAHFGPGHRRCAWGSRSGWCGLTGWRGWQAKREAGPLARRTATPEGAPDEVDAFLGDRAAVAGRRFAARGLRTPPPATLEPLRL